MNSQIAIENTYKSGGFFHLFRGIILMIENKTQWQDAQYCFKSHPLMDMTKEEEWFTSNHNHDKDTMYVDYPFFSGD